MSALKILVIATETIFGLGGVAGIALGYLWDDIDSVYTGILVSGIGALSLFMTTLISAMPA